VLAGLSDDDPAGITTYSILGAKYGYRLLWVLAVSTAALIVFHELGARMGVVTGKGLLALVRERYGRRGASIVLSALVVANLGTLCAEFAGVAAGLELLAGVTRYLSVPLAAVVVSLWSCAAPFTAWSTSCWRLARFSLATSSPGFSRTRAGPLPQRGWSSRACL
jgi:NRAMP (natural resistance-associated macrophage protein)-like metal ion transporter